VKLYAETQPLLSRYGVENQLDAMFSPVVQLRSGGYIVLNQAEALVAIDVNSGRATREHHIEDTALKTNMEASDEIARQLRLRDLAGLIVIDFIDMDEKRNNRSVERRLKECLKQDRARIQVGRISHFGLLEMSRQRIRTSVLESSTEKCPYCGGSGHVRSVSSLALQVLRALEEQLIKGATHNLIARTRPDVALYVLNQKRAHLRGLEERYSITITVTADEAITAPQAFVIDRGEQVHTIEAARAIAAQTPAIAVPLEEEDDLEEPAAIESEEAEAVAADETPEHSENESEGQGDGGRRRRRRRRGRDGGDRPPRGQPSHEGVAETVGEFSAAAEGEPSADEDGAERQGGLAHGEGEERAESDSRAADLHRDGGRRRRRGRRGGRRTRERNGEATSVSHDRGPEAEEHAFGPGEELTSPPEPQPELQTAVADLDAAPPSAASEPINEEATRPPAPAEQEPPRRRSTVRERAPVATGENPSTPPPAPMPSVESVPAPAAESNEAEATDRPRKTGWWSKRFG
jgi:ribonuclease E